jgi:hypothetical protein
MQHANTRSQEQTWIPPLDKQGVIIREHISRPIRSLFYGHRLCGPPLLTRSRQHGKGLPTIEDVS